jgi:aspartyl-tRNA(Asn)/glutamyl-tRNA(Gln) amidotransferase subunit A
MNYLGVPSVSLPMGLDSNGLPMGLQIQGRPFAEGTILKIADAFQRGTDHHSTLPPMLS